MKTHRPEIRLASPASQRGASLLEGIAYLGIAALVILGAASLFTGAFASAQSNRGMEEVNAIRTGVKKLYMGQANSYGAVDITPALNTAAVFPTTLSYNGANMSNTWGGTVSVKGASNTFTITYTAVPQDSCINMLSGASGWFSVAGNGGTAISTSPLTPDNAATICSVSGAAGNTIDFVSL
ncbi:MAG TPA: type 4 pilus major pilin [Burkholderiaceae bacterium]|jgi:hypothetical protein